MADYLVKKGMPFREAHEVVGKAVLYCVERGRYLADLTLEEFKGFSALFEDDIYQAIAPETCVNLRTSQGGTAPAEVERQLALAAEILARRAG